MQILQVEKPRMADVKRGGLMDAIRNDKFVEYLCDKWPTPEYMRDEKDDKEQTDAIKILK